MRLMTGQSLSRTKHKCSSVYESSERQMADTKRRMGPLFLYLLLAPCIMLFCLILWSDRRFSLPEMLLRNLDPLKEVSNNSVFPAEDILSTLSIPLLSVDPSIINAPPVPAQSLSAILPVTSGSLLNLEAILSPFLVPSNVLREVIMACPESLLSDTRQVVRRMVFAVKDKSHPEISIRPWMRDMDTNEGVFYLATQAATEWVLLLDESGLQGIYHTEREYLINPLSIKLPVGPRGAVISSVNVSCLLASQSPQSASFLVPPFVVPSELLASGGFSRSPNSGIWASLGRYISQTQLNMIGGVVMRSSQTNIDWCSAAQREIRPTPGGHFDPFISRHSAHSVMHPSSHHINDYHSVERTGGPNPCGVFAILLPSLLDLQAFSPVACRLKESGHVVHIMLYLKNLSDDDPSLRHDSSTGHGRCRLAYDTLSPEDERTAYSMEYISSWLDMYKTPNVIITTDDSDTSTSSLSSITRQAQYLQTTHIQIPRGDFMYSSWMGAMSLKEWRNWHIPAVQISVITNDRPRSLARLLTSMSRARYFGDRLDLRVNLEQTADAETLQTVDHFKWNHGSTFVHHRVIHGGLLPAVVESWYPYSNHTYGLLLEDDVELSPLFYAWVKFSILRYRYSERRNASPDLFGISLYQQKNIELRLEGRRPFNARSLFTDQGLPYPNTPYLSQIPCSWGAVYFPEHWREFHEYLSFRLTEITVSIGQDVVPNIRSNRWTHSWKKFFIELVYLRGYVMLYPNYRDFVSLSTNHLEVGSHVKDIPNDLYTQKKDMFLLPLMELSDGLVPQDKSTGLLDLPEATLPSWPSLPVLDLAGAMSSLEDISRRGLERQTSLFNCTHLSDIRYSIRDMVCIDDPPAD